MKFSIREWRGKVYRTEPPLDLMKSAEWRKTRRAVFYRDRYHCLRCDKRFRSDNLTAHHLIPRSEGGWHDMTNLVSLCNSCHDFAEINDLRTRASIMGSIAYVEELPTEDYENGDDEQENDVDLHRPIWHAWVYGGKRHRL